MQASQQQEFYVATGKGVAYDLSELTAEDMKDLEPIPAPPKIESFGDFMSTMLQHHFARHEDAIRKANKKPVGVVENVKEAASTVLNGAMDIAGFTGATVLAVGRIPLEMVGILDEIVEVPKPVVYPGWEAAVARRNELIARSIKKRVAKHAARADIAADQATLQPALAELAGEGEPAEAAAQQPEGAPQPSAYAAHVTTFLQSYLEEALKKISNPILREATRVAVTKMVDDLLPLEAKGKTLTDDDIRNLVDNVVVAALAEDAPAEVEGKEEGTTLKVQTYGADLAAQQDDEPPFVRFMKHFQRVARTIQFSDAWHVVADEAKGEVGGLFANVTRNPMMRAQIELGTVVKSADPQGNAILFFGVNEGILTLFVQQQDDSQPIVRLVAPPGFEKLYSKLRLDKQRISDALTHDDLDIVFGDDDLHEHYIGNRQLAKRRNRNHRR